MPYATFLRGSKHPPNLNPGGSGVESTARNCRKQLKKRVADCKHGFESRWGHQGIWSMFEGFVFEDHREQDSNTEPVSSLDPA